MYNMLPPRRDNFCPNGYNLNKFGRVLLDNAILNIKVLGLVVFSQDDFSYIPYTCICDGFLGFVTFPCGVLGQVWYLIVSIPDICPLPYFVNQVFKKDYFLKDKYCLKTDS